VLSDNGRVLGMMPHPERAIEPAALSALGGGDGRRLFENILASLTSA
jgi:phosphoribosylformylglycinamidine synthase subunit PurQ / glutaminase